MLTSQGGANDKGSAGSLPRKSGDKIGVPGASREAMGQKQVTWELPMFGL